MSKETVNLYKCKQNLEAHISWKWQSEKIKENLGVVFPVIEFLFCNLYFTVCTQHESCC